MYWLEHRADLLFRLSRLKLLRDLEACVEDAGEECLTFWD